LACAPPRFALRTNRRPTPSPAHQRPTTIRRCRALSPRHASTCARNRFHPRRNSQIVFRVSQRHAALKTLEGTFAAETCGASTACALDQNDPTRPSKSRKARVRVFGRMRQRPPAEAVWKSSTNFSAGKLWSRWQAKEVTIFTGKRQRSEQEGRKFFHPRRGESGRYSDRSAAIGVEH
jgi:hypothetical protein